MTKKNENRFTSAQVLDNYAQCETITLEMLVTLDDLRKELPGFFGNVLSGTYSEAKERGQRVELRIRITEDRNEEIDKQIGDIVVQAATEVCADAGIRIIEGI